MRDDITEDYLYVERVNFLVKAVRQFYDNAQKEKDKGNTIKYNKFYKKYLEYKNELAELREVAV